MRLGQFIISALFILFSFHALAQKKNTKNSQSQTQPSSIDAFAPQRQYAPVQSKSKSKGCKTTYDAREDFYKRMEIVAKNRRKAEKELMKPQYSDPSYFGHKKKPKKRPPGKTKYCKECGIRH